MQLSTNYETNYELQMNKTTLFWKKYRLDLKGIALLARLYAFTLIVQRPRQHLLKDFSLF